MEELIPIFFIVFSHTAAFGILAIYYRNRHRERTLMIERGVDPSIFMQKQKNSTSTALKYGLFLLGVGIGIMLGGVIESLTPIPVPVGYLSMIAIFGGLGLLAYYLIDRKNGESSRG